jgi:hypothetical protein
MSVGKLHRSGNPKLISEYLDCSARFDHSITKSAEAYADQNEKDYQEFRVGCSETTVVGHCRVIVRRRLNSGNGPHLPALALDSNGFLAKTRIPFLRRL